MGKQLSERTLRLWPGVVIVILQLSAAYVPSMLDLDNLTVFYTSMGSLLLGTLLLFVWWLALSRARWFDRVGGVALLIAVHAVSMTLADPTAKIAALISGVPWLCATFVASLFLAKRRVTIAAVLVASLGWTLVQTGGVTGTMGMDYSWRWSPTAEDRFLASSASAPPAASASVLENEAAFETAAWPGFRGAKRDGIVSGVTIGTDWERDPPRELWRRAVGPGWSSFALVGDRLCTQEQREEDEAVVCYDAATGEPIWIHSYRARYWESMAGAGPRSTPTYHEGRLYTLGATGILNSLDAASGALLWTRDLKDDTGAPIPDWGFASSPLIVDDLVVVHAPGAADDRTLVAYDRVGGEPRWSGEAGGAGFCSPHLAMIEGVAQILLLTADGAFGFDPGSGDRLWRHDWPMGDAGSRVVQPAVVEGNDDILIGTSFGFGTRRIDVTADDASGGWRVAEIWTSKGLKPYYNDLVLHRGAAYGFDGHILAAIDLETGDRLWKGGRYGNGQLLLLADQDLLLVTSERGELALVRASTDGFDELARIQAIEGKSWNHPILADGVLYVRNDEEAAAYRLPR